MTEFLNPQLSFNPAGPFYGLVVSYLCQVHGFNEIASRGARAKMDELEPDILREMVSSVEDVRTRDSLESIASSGVTGLLLESGLHAEAGERISISIPILANELWADHKPAMAFLNRLSAGSLLLLSWEMTYANHTQDPIWEFARHCRHAAAHNGRFLFKRHEPRRPAVWRGLEITRVLKGAVLFNDGKERGFLGPGDVLYLLADLEAQYFKPVEATQPDVGLGPALPNSRVSG